MPPTQSQTQRIAAEIERIVARSGVDLNRTDRCVLVETDAFWDDVPKIAVAVGTLLCRPVAGRFPNCGRIARSGVCACADTAAIDAAMRTARNAGQRMGPPPARSDRFGSKPAMLRRATKRGELCRRTVENRRAMVEAGTDKILAPKPPKPYV